MVYHSGMGGVIIMRTIGEVARLSGVSIRTLRLYDEAGLLPPASVTEAGYRLYDDAALERLQMILLFRALRFPLKDIREMLLSPAFSMQEALGLQITLLEMQRAQLDRLINHARQLQQNGGSIMSFSAFDTTNQDQYADEVRQRWGDTDAYRDYAQRSKGRTKQDASLAADAMMRIFAAFGDIRHTSPDSDDAQQLVAQLQQHISANYYECTPEILRGLGRMYTADERFAANIDKAGGEGTADFAARAIEVFCR